MDEPEKWTIIGAIGAVAGALIKTVGDRLTARDAREISERDLWAKLQTMERRLDNVNVRLDEARKECADLRAVIGKLETENRGLRDQLQTLEQQYRRLQGEYDALLAEQQRRSRSGKTSSKAQEPGQTG